MFQILIWVKYKNTYKKAAIFFRETKYMTFINISNTNFQAYMYLVMGFHVSMSISLKVDARRSISGNGCLISIIINYFSHFTISFP